MSDLRGNPRNCAWCNGPVKQLRRLFCSTPCRLEFEFYGSRASRAQVEARMANAAQQPRGTATVAEFIARGGTIYRE